jgi:hypothetical protein
MKFRVVHIQPPIASALNHWDIARLLHHSLCSLGHDSTIAVNEVDRACINIIVGYERIASAKAIAATQYIPYQLEQFSAGDGGIMPHMQQILLGAREVWDYDERNLKYLKGIGVKNVKLVPLGYHEAMATIKPRKEDVDVLFYGKMTPGRKDILQKLGPKCKLMALEGCYGEERDEWIGRSKIVLNLHYFPERVIEQVRVSYLLNNSKCVVSEQSEFDPLAPYCEMAPYLTVAQTCLRLLANETQRLAVVERAKGFRSRPMTENIRIALG